MNRCLSRRFSSWSSQRGSRAYQFGPALNGCASSMSAQSSGSRPWDRGCVFRALKAVSSLKRELRFVVGGVEPPALAGFVEDVVDRAAPEVAYLADGHSPAERRRLAFD